jgi:hypothetical protein
MMMLRSTLPSRSFVIPRLGLGIHEFLSGRSKLVDAKAKPWHDGGVDGTDGASQARA